MNGQEQFNQPDPFTPSSPPSGPQFNMESKGGWGQKFRGWINKYGSSVVLPIIALIILAGGIYLYVSQRNQAANLIPEETSNLENIPGAGQDFIPRTDQTISQEETQVEKIIPQGRKEGQNIIQKAAKGEGVTHLARRALKDYLKDNPQDLTNQHKVYIEDYLKDKIGSKPLEVDEEISFSEDLIQEAIDASQQLTPDQLKVLEQYSALVDWTR